ncbi:MAG: putative lipid II flippase FtsW [Actinomycetes bacterium]
MRQATAALRAAVGERARLFDRPLTSYYLVLGSTALLTVLGLVMVLSASSVSSYTTSGSSFALFEKQALWVLVGVMLLCGGSRLSPRVYRLAAYPLLLGSLALLVLVQVPGLGVEVNGNRNWLALGGGFRLQPSEFAKFALLIFGADLLARKQRLLGQWKHLLVPLLPVAALVTALVLVGGDLGTGLIVMAITGALLFFAGAPMRLFVLVALAGMALVARLVLAEEYRLERLKSWLDPTAPENYELGGWQAAHGFFALATGGWFGQGIGESREKWGGLPEAHTDFIFAIIGEELGLVGTLAVLLLFATLGFAGIRVASRVRDPFVRLAAAATTTWLVVQALVNVGAVLGLLPITGIPLPLVSYGGSAMLPTMLALGMLLSFAKREPGAQAAMAARGPGWPTRLARWRPWRRA